MKRLEVLAFYVSQGPPNLSKSVKQHGNMEKTMRSIESQSQMKWSLWRPEANVDIYNIYEHKIGCFDAARLQDWKIT